MDIESYQKDNTKCLTLQCDIPEVCKTEPCWLGIDEAGRGPVLGPMVYGICYSPVSLREKFESSGFADSKTLTEVQREGLFDKIHENRDWIGWLVEILSPMYISNSMLRRAKYNLNALSHDCAIGMIRKALEQGAMITEVYVDTVGDPGKYQAKLAALFPQISITVAKKADSLYPIVSAASICAKVARDRAVKTWHFIESSKVKVPETGYGSGYPNDPKTKNFLESSLDSVFGFPSFVRFSWSTASNIIDSKCARASWDDDEDEEETRKSNKRAAKHTPSLYSMFAGKDTTKTEYKPHIFFKERGLSSVSNI